MSELFPFFDSQPESKTEARWLRMLEAAGCRTQQELAGVLGIEEAHIYGAKTFGFMPPEWLVELACLYSANPYWILHGTGPKFLVPSEHPDGPCPATETHPPLCAGNAEILRGILRCFPSDNLEKELLRRERNRIEGTR